MTVTHEERMQKKKAVIDGALLSASLPAPSATA